MTVTLDLTAGEVRVAEAVVAEARDASQVAIGAVRLSTGAVVVPIGFGERMQLCALHRGRDALGAALVAAAVREGSVGADREIAEILALHLAGARAESDRPGFADVAVTMRRVFGWDAAGLLAAPAHVVDELAASVSGTLDNGSADGWVSFELRDVGTPTGSVAPNPSARLADVRRQLVDDLLRRGAAPLTADVSHAMHEGDVGAGAGAGAGAPGPTTRSVSRPVDAGAAGESTARRGPAVAGAPGDDHDRRREATTLDALSASSASARDDPVAGPHIHGDAPEAAPETAGHESRPATPATGRFAARGSAAAPADPRVMPVGEPWPHRRDDAPGPRPAGRAERPSDRYGSRAGADPSGPGHLPTPTEARVPSTWWPAAPGRAGPGAPSAVAGDAAPSGLRAVPPGGPTPLDHPDIAGIADELATALDDEADIRGLLRW